MFVIFYLSYFYDPKFVIGLLFNCSFDHSMLVGCLMERQNHLSIYRHFASLFDLRGRFQPESHVKF